MFNSLLFMKLFKVFTALLVLSFTTHSFAQAVYTAGLDEQFHVGAGAKWGAVWINADNFNKVFEENGLPKLEGASFGGGVEMYLGNRNNIAFYTLGASMFSQFQENDSSSVRLRTTFLEFYSDFNIYRSDRLLIHPSVGLNIAMAKLNINKTNNPPSTIDGVLTDYSSTQRIVSDNLGVGLDVGIGSEVYFGSTMKKSIGLKLGYKFSITKNRYASAGQRIQDAPGMQLSGLYFTNYYTLW